MRLTQTSRQSDVTLRIHQDDAQKVGVALALARASREAATRPASAGADLPDPTSAEYVAHNPCLLLCSLATGQLKQANDDADTLLGMLTRLAQSSAHERMQLADLISGAGR